PVSISAYCTLRTDLPGGERGPAFAYPFGHGRLLLENTIPIHAVLFRRGAVQAGCRFDPAFDRLEDWDFWLQVARLGGFVFVPACTANYRVAGGSGFGAREQEEADTYRLAVFRKWLPRWSAADILELTRRGREFPRIGHLEREGTELRGALAVRERQVEELGNSLLEARDHAARLALDLRDLHAQVQHKQSEV